jgi:class 3 adenylate cyclase/tetratricopeptide (TPR) repeat protein
MTAEPADAPCAAEVQVRLLGSFRVCFGELEAGPWPRPTAKRLCELVLISPGRRISRDLACELLFPDHAPADAGRALAKALSLARRFLAGLGEPGAQLLQADRANIWAMPRPALEIDTERHEEALKAALAMAPGADRDHHLVAALAVHAIVLADEPYADWATELRERIQDLRQQARLALARDRAKGAGQSRPEAVVVAWESCLAHDPACEEAAAALIRAYSTQGLRHLVVRTYERCRTALEELGLRPSPALVEVQATALFEPPGVRLVPIRAAGHWQGAASRAEERRLVSILFAEVVTAHEQAKEDPEDLRDLVGEGLTRVITAVEGLGGTVTAVSGAGLQALFGAPEAHEDDPERAVRAAFRALTGAPTRAAAEAPAMRIGVETGPAVVGRAEAGASSYYQVVGAVVAAAAGLQSVAKASSVLVGPTTRAATEGVFEWGPTEEVVLANDAKPLVGAYLEQPKPRAPGRQLRLGGRGRLVGRDAEVSALAAALERTEAGTGAVVVVVGEPGLGKTRLVQECRTRFMAWVGARSGRLPLWLEGRCASYMSMTPYGLYRHLLASWVGVAADQSADVVGPALQRGLAAVMGNQDLWPLLARMADLPAGMALVPMSPSELQHATFSAIRAVVARLAGVGPTVLVLEDLHWADATSLSLTEVLASLTLEVPLLIVATRRPHPDPGVSALELALMQRLGQNLEHLELAPLPEAAERDLTLSFVGKDAGPGVVDAVRRGTDGNPLFLEERLFGMLESGALVQELGRWRLSETLAPEVPDVLERLVRSRVDHLSHGAQEVVRAAAVIGTEVGAAVLHNICDICDTGNQLDERLTELCDAGLIQTIPNAPERTFRFRHALIQEATYRGMLRRERKYLHGRVAWALESLSEGRFPEVAAVLGRHFAAGGEQQRAAHYFEIAGDHAKAAYANTEAIASFRSALDLVSANPPLYSVAVAQRLWDKLGDISGTAGRRNDARYAYQQAIALADPSDTLTLARLHTWLGALETQDRCFEAAPPHFEEAKELLGDNPGGRDQATADRWIGLMFAWSEHYRSQSLPAQELTVLEEMRPVVEERGSTRQRSENLFLIAKAQAELARYRVSDEVLADMRRAVEMVPDRGQQEGGGWQPLLFGYLGFLKGDVGLAREQAERALAMAEKRSEAQLRAACMFFRPMIEVRAHDIEAVRQLGPVGVEACEAIGFPEWVANAKGTLAWLAYQEGRPDDVLALAAECDELMKAPHGPEVFLNWVRLWPVVGVHLAVGRVGPAIAAARQMLDPSQQRFEDELESLLIASSEAWDAGDPGRAKATLEKALVVAQELRYC